MSGIDFNSRISYDPYHIYYDLNIVNNDTTGTRKPPFLQFTEIRNTPYLMSPSEYFCSVVRFSLETPSLPLVIPQVKLDSMNVNDLIYSITLNHTVLIPNGIQRFVQYIPQSTAAYAPPPNPPTTAADLTNEYYYTFSFKPFIDMVNNALRSAWAQALIDVPALVAAAYTIDNFPYLWWDEDANIATFVAPTQIFQTDSPNNPNPTLLAALGNEPIAIFMNTPLFNLFSSFTAYLNGYENTSGFAFVPTTFGRNWAIELPDTVSTNPYAVDNAGTVQTLPQINGASCLRVSQEYPTSPLWNPVQSIVFTTSLLPIAPSLVSAPVLYGTGKSLTSAGNNSNLANILTDLEIPMDKGWQTKPSINYLPTAEYRLFDLNGNAPLSAIEISVFWKDSFGQIHPFLLASGSNSSLKIMFRRKDFQGVV
jgi:hypothetical protein